MSGFEGRRKPGKGSSAGVFFFSFSFLLSFLQGVFGGVELRGKTPHCGGLLAVFPC